MKEYGLANKKKIASGVSIVLLSVTIVLLIAWTTGPFYYHFASRRLVRIYSYIQLFTTAIVSFFVYRNLEKANPMRWWQNPSARPFFISAIGFLFLGLDDVFSLHEGIDDLIHLVLHIEKTPLTDHLDDLILLLYVVIAIFFIKDFVREFRKYPFMIGLIICGLLASCVMMGFDFLSNNEETFAYFFKGLTYGQMRHTKDIFSMGDGSFQLLGEAFFLAAYVAALAAIKIKPRPHDR
jgi:hypothetical protein